MKKKIIIAAMAVLTLSAGLFFAIQSQTPDLFKANLNALSDEEGTPAALCHFRAADGDPQLFQYYLECDSKTNDGMLYPCPVNKLPFISQSSSHCIQSN